ncbi:NRDE family protein [Marinobacter confluentis]|uniref:NRDE family protein n=1 Tax=Marinobacter confluentis TaxID=1697557 RepID=A0A4Z1BFZ0_9GAMM|nr:NRDE family protein [Marinobacter confluentis]TGN38166.1 NRDE family protein [Marinobacter confluentis]
MCLIVFSVNQHPEFPLVMAANRDEFFRRPTAGMDWWQSDLAGAEVLAGRDLLSGGTWLAVSRDGVVSAVTNVRESSDAPAARSRGELPLMAQNLRSDELQRSLLPDRNQYAGFNLVQLNSRGGWYFSNRDAHPGRYIHRGIFGLSNHLLQTPWPKLLKLRTEVNQALRGTSAAQADQLHDTLVGQLQDTTPAPDQQLPDTGVGIETERFLSSPFIKSKDYGTRATTIVSLSRHGEMMVTEQSYGPNAEKSEHRRFRWQRSP